MHFLRDPKRSCVRVRIQFIGQLLQRKYTNHTRRIEGIECEVQYLKNQLDEMRNLLQHNRSHSSIHSQESVSPRQVLESQQHEVRGDSGCPSSHSQITLAEDDIVTLAVPDNTAYLNTQTVHSYPRSGPDLSSPHEIAVQPRYEASTSEMSSLKRKRSCFEISEDSVADFIDKGLITMEYAVSYFDTYVLLSASSFRIATDLNVQLFSRLRMSRLIKAQQQAMVVY